MSPLAADEVRVWYRFTESMTDDEVEEQLTTLLSPEEQARARRFVFARDRRDFTAAHVLLRRTLSLYGDRSPAAWAFDVPSGGKPAIASGQASALEFNLSHTHGLVACAVARDTSVGVDVESIARVLSEREIAARFFSPAECVGLDACAPAEYTQRFIELWTLKESYLKGIGTGLSHPLDNFSFAFEDPRGLTFAAPPDVRTAEWQFLLAAPASSYRLAVAVRRDDISRRYRVILQDAGSGPAAAILRASTA